MDLEGFGASLIGRALYVYANHDKAWIPWEFISGTPYSCKILVTGHTSGLRMLEAEHTWTVVVSPSAARDWSCLATIIRSMGPTVLLVFDVGAPVAPASFIGFMDGLLGEGRIVVTRVWVGEHIEIPTIPDAVFFPVVVPDEKLHQEVYGLLGRLPARSGHGPWTPISAQDWSAIVKATHASHLGIVISDVGEPQWTLFWHKIEDSRAESRSILLKRGMAWTRTGLAIVEKNHEP